MKIDDIIEQLEKEPAEIQSNFIKCLTFYVTISIRSIGKYEDLTNQQKLESILHINEFNHQVLTRSLSLPSELHRLKDIAARLAIKSKATAEELGAIIDSAIKSSKGKITEE